MQRGFPPSASAPLTITIERIARAWAATSRGGTTAKSGCRDRYAPPGRRFPPAGHAWLGLP